MSNNLELVSRTLGSRRAFLRTGPSVAPPAPISMDTRLGDRLPLKGGVREIPSRRLSN
jgi:hypothetical protein